ncbi:hypothetical protein HWB92_gp084 [Serratia phage vB_SmaA_3M]|uniref:5-hmdU DNA kinase helical domain-containing protein n=1 Tax=Serratia phage vB_SmaA_3M TaxID=2419930 RepID=A0A3G2YS57_9CAUD|nr:hypothetical protein HWB92_gp084 [Serratia phage vB_SmaA_3M]AYP28342.1 hypothetical protein 3M_086 [Serratia phage vB_SmaA_3M]
MKDKVYDIPYCGVDEYRIKHANPVLNPRVRLYAYQWMAERYQIHIRKDVYKQPAPWTDNQILRQVKFCNVRREHDRQSQYLIKNIVNSDLPLADKLFNCVMFRMFNLWGPIEAIGGPFTIAEFVALDLDQARSDLIKYESAGNPVFTNAFNTGGLKQSLAFPERAVHAADKVSGDTEVRVFRTGGVIDVMPYKQAKILLANNPGEYVVDGRETHMGMRVVRFLKQYMKEFPHYFEGILELDSPQEVYECLLNDIEGLGPFLAYQVWVDFTYNPDYPFSENHFTIAGPGCRNGIDLLFNQKDGMTYEECIFWLRDNQDEVFGQYGYKREEFWTGEEDHDCCMNVMQLENMFCEIQKYMRCVDAVQEGKKPRGKVGYDGAGNKQARTGSANLLNMMRK